MLWLKCWALSLCANVGSRDWRETRKWRGFVIRPTKGRQCFSIFFLVHYHLLPRLPDLNDLWLLFARACWVPEGKCSWIMGVDCIRSYLNMIGSTAQFPLVPPLGPWLSLVSFRLSLHDHAMYISAMYISLNSHRWHGWHCLCDWCPHQWFCICELDDLTIVRIPYYFEWWWQNYWHEFWASTIGDRSSLVITSSRFGPHLENAVRACSHSAQYLTYCPEGSTFRRTRINFPLHLCSTSGTYIDDAVRACSFARPNLS